MRPDVVLFDEMLPVAALDLLDSQLRKGFELVVSIGTSSQFAYIVHPVLAAVQSGVPTIEINPAESTDLSHLVDLHIRMGARDALTAIAKQPGTGIAGS
jgi:NAD-dependent deacetylase